MKKLTILLVLITNFTLNAQELFSFGEKETFITSFTVDPNATKEEKGLNSAIDLEYAGPLYVKVGAEFFPALTGGYTEFRWGIGPNFTLGDKENFRYYAGIRTAIVFRENQGGYTGYRINYGVEAGFDFTINKHYTIGLITSGIYRYDQEILGWNPEFKISGGVKIGYKWYFDKRYN